MAYATSTDFDNLGLPEAAFASLTLAEKNAHLTAASGKIDEAIAMGGRYTPPLTTYGAGVTGYCVDIARWTAIVRRGFNPDNPGDRAVLLAFEAAEKWLAKLEDGAAIAGVVDATPTDDDGAPAVASDARQDWLVDSSFDLETGEEIAQ